MRITGACTAALSVAVTNSPPDWNRFMTTPSRTIHGFVAPGFEGVRKTLQEQFDAGRQIGAALSVWKGETCVVDLWGGYADKDTRTPWTADTRIVLFSVTKGFVAMAFHLLADRGVLDWDAPVAAYWPEFSQNGKEQMTVRTLLEHRGGLPALRQKFSVRDCYDPARYPAVLRAMEQQKPRWTPGTAQGYHTITYGLYAAELFERITGECIGDFLHCEFFLPTTSDVRLGTPASEDHKFATLYPPSTPTRIAMMIRDRFQFPHAADAGILNTFLLPRSISRQSLTNPRFSFNRVGPYNTPEVYRHVLAWASATGSARGVARAYIPFVQNGRIDQTQLLSEAVARAPQKRSGWSERDLTLKKPIGWTNGFVKERPGVFGPNIEAFGHPGMGGTIGWADPAAGISIGYTHNRMGWRVRPRRPLELIASIYASIT